MTAGASLYVGTVTHSRLEPLEHRFRYRVFYGLFDIDRLEELSQSLRLFSLRRFNLFGFNPADYGPADGSPLRPWVEQAMSDAGVSVENGKILLLTFPRVLGHVFNPLSIWYCYGPDQTLKGVIYEVRNTFGDRHSYVVPVGEDRKLSHRFDKRLHVSPFNEMDQTYEFSITEPGRGLSVSIDQSERGSRVLRAGMALTRLPMTDSNLLRMFVTHPLVTIKVVCAIHWEALKLWAKGAVFHRRPEPASHTITVVEAGATAR